MSNNFWTAQLAKRTNPNARVPVSPPPTQGTAWWQTPPAQPQQQAPVPPQDQNWNEAQQGVYNASANPIQAQSIKQSGACPNCGGADYFAPVNTPNAVPRCFECGHRQNYTAPTSQPLGSMRMSGENVTATRQIHDGSSNFSWQINEKL